MNQIDFFKSINYKSNQNVTNIRMYRAYILRSYNTGHVSQRALYLFNYYIVLSMIVVRGYVEQLT
jgi:hypothetical protein